MNIESVIIGRSRTVHRLLREQQADQLFIYKQFPDLGSAKPFLLQYPVDLVFLDLHLAGTNFPEWYGSLPSQPLLVCMAGKGENALEAFNIDAVDCLVDPIDHARFRHAMEKVHRAICIRRFTNESGRPYIFLRSQYQLVKIMFEDIRYIEAKIDYVKIHRHQKPPVAANVTMRHLADNLPSWRFMRIHRAFIVAVDNICRFDSNQVYLGETRFPIGPTFREAVIQSIRKKISL
jgi:DNA-binding LytR/AlgR family response regulator